MGNNSILDGNNATARDNNIHTTSTNQSHITHPTPASSANADNGNGGSINAIESTPPSNSHASKQSSVNAEAEGHSKSRKRFSKSVDAKHKNYIASAIQAKKSLTLLRHKLGLSNTQFKNYIAELAMAGEVSFDSYTDNVVTTTTLAPSIMRFLDVQNTKIALFELTMQEDGILVTAVNLD